MSIPNVGDIVSFELPEHDSWDPLRQERYWEVTGITREPTSRAFTLKVQGTSGSKASMGTGWVLFDDEVTVHPFLRMVYEYKRQRHAGS